MGSKLEELVNNFIEKHVNRNLKQLALGSTEHEHNEHYEHNPQEDYFYEQMRQVKTEIKTEEESFLDKTGEYDRTENTLDQDDIVSDHENDIVDESLKSIKEEEIYEKEIYEENDPDYEET